MTTQSHSSFNLSAGEIHIVRFEPFLCVISRFLPSLPLGLLQLQCCKFKTLGFSAASTTPQIGGDLPTQVNRCTCVRLAPATNPPSCPPLWPSDIQMHPWNLPFPSIPLPWPPVLSLLHGSSLSLLCHRCFVEPALLAPPPCTRLIKLSRRSL